MDEIVEIHPADPENPAWLEWPCTTCGERSDVLYDPGAGRSQELVEDCSVCCRPNVVLIEVEPGSSSLRVTVRPEYR